jgi:hypothetical protein
LAERSTVWIQHRILLAEPDDVLDVARAAAKIREHARELAATGAGARA